MTQTQDAFRRENEPFDKKQSHHMNKELNFEVRAVTAVSHCESDVTARQREVQRVVLLLRIFQSNTGWGKKVLHHNVGHFEKVIYTFPSNVVLFICNYEASRQVNLLFY